MAIRIEHPTDGTRFAPERALDITASVCGALFGEHDYTTEWALYQQHANGALPSMASKLARFGTHMENAIAELLELEHGLVTERETGYWRDPVVRMGASLDRWCYRWGDQDEVYEKGIPLDIKMVSSHAWRAKWNKGETIPNQYVMQLQMQCGLVSADAGMLGCLVAGEDTHVVKVPFSPALYHELKVRVAAFWKAVEERREPLPTNDDAEQVLKLYRRTTEGKVIDLSKDNAAHALAETYIKQKAVKQEADKAAREAAKGYDETRAALLFKMKDAETAKVGPLLINAKTTPRAGYTVKPGETRSLTIEKA